MRRLLVALLVALQAAAREITDNDPDSDPARFMVHICRWTDLTWIVVEHENGHRCSASLVSTRTVITTARCVRGQGSGERRELWALAAALVGARPPAPLAAAARRVSRIALAGDGIDPDDPALDIAVLELEAPFGGEAHSQPILMATSQDDCDNPICNAIRALPALIRVSSTKGRGVRLRVVELKRARDDHCMGRVPHWAASRERMMCLTGDELCERDLGGAVVCGGKLCGVLSAVVGEGKVMGNDTKARQVCGNTLAAQSVARWRLFLHCAYTLRLCGSGNCAGQCTEQRLLDDEKTVSHSTTTTTIVTVSKKTTELITRTSIAESSISIDTKSASFPSYVSSTSYSSPPSSSVSTRRRSLTTRPPLANPSQFLLFDATMEPLPSMRPLPEFEPNRPDFKAAPIQPTRVGLKAGEYGDNAADYGGEEAAPRGILSTFSTPTRSASTPHRQRPAPALLAAQAAPPQESATKSCTCPVNAPCTSLLCIVMCFLEYCSRNKKVQN